MQRGRVINGRDGNELTSKKTVLRRWKEYFQDLMNVGYMRELDSYHLSQVEGRAAVERYLVQLTYLWRYGDVQEKRQWTFKQST